MIIDKTWAADLYLKYKLEPKASICLSDKDQMRMLYLAYQIHTSNCSAGFWPTIVRYGHTLNKTLSHINRYWFPLCFPHKLLKGIWNEKFGFEENPLIWKNFWNYKDWSLQLLRISLQPWDIWICLICKSLHRIFEIMPLNGSKVLV